MKTIHKFTHPVSAEFEISVPVCATLLKVGRDTRNPNDLAFWFEVDTEEEHKAPRRFRVVGTGQAIPTCGAIYVDSIQMGSFIWHVYRG